MTTEKFAEISMKIITFVGVAKSLAIEAIRIAREQKSSDAVTKAVEPLFKEAKENLVSAAKVHVEVLQSEAQGDGLGTSPTVLFMHAEDQMMSAEIILALATEMVDLIKDIVDNKTKMFSMLNKNQKSCCHS